MHKFFFRLFSYYVLCLGACSFLFISPVQAQSIIRDTEIEQTLKIWTTPIFRAAGLVPDNVNIILIQDNNLNAFVAGGANIFIYTGLLEAAENPGEIIGVIAHETGHISGGHLIRMRTSVEQASYETIIGTILGIGAAVLTGDGGAAGAIIGGSQTMASSRFLSNSRLNESSADQAGLRFMSAAGYNPSGLVTFLQKLEGNELLPASQQSEYVRTHPLTSNRIGALRTNVNNSVNKDKDFPPGWVEEFNRMKAKLKGFISPEQVQWNYASDTSMSGKYARAIAAYRTNNIDQALSLTDQLIAAEKNNPYFQELKGQMLVDFSRVEQALPYYERAVSLAPNAPLIRTAYAHALIESANRSASAEQYQHAISELNIAKRDEKRSTRIHRLLATAYGRLGNETNARLNLAEEAVLQQRFPDAKKFARYVQDNSAKNSSENIRAADIINFIEENEKDR